jgi:hypothetical protein
LILKNQYYGNEASKLFGIDQCYTETGMYLIYEIMPSVFESSWQWRGARLQKEFEIFFW